MKSDIYPVAQRLIDYASNKLTAKDKAIFMLVVNQLFIDLDYGHSCTNLEGLLRRTKNAVAAAHSATAQNTTDGTLATYSLTRICKILEQSGLVAIVTTTPEQLVAKPITLLKLEGISLLFITKYLQYELNIAKQINKFMSVDVTRMVQDSAWNDNNAPMKLLRGLQQQQGLPNTEQLQAIENSLKQKLSIITGGPGTGKTTTVIFLLWLFYQMYANDLKIKVCAPTGKAVKRVQSSIVANLEKYSNLLPNCQALRELVGNNEHFVTIHKLLGSIPNNIYFKHNATNPLDVDILIIDESSMISLPLFSKLIQAIDPRRTKHIIFLGDKNQLSSVEEGYVFATMVQNKILSPNRWQYDLLSDSTVSVVSDLQISNRNLGDVKTLAQAILAQNTTLFNTILNNSAEIKLLKPDVMRFLHQLFAAQNTAILEYVAYIRQYQVRLPNSRGSVIPDSIRDPCFEIPRYQDMSHIIQSAGMPKHELYVQLFNSFTQEAILCLTNVGTMGTNNINRLIEKKVVQLLNINTLWYTGRPIMILENDYALGVSNGDIGFCVIRQDNKISILFDGGREYIPEILPKYQLAYAITIHKAQGSEYNHVNILLPNSTSQGYMLELCSRELIYTAITRAHCTVTIFADINTLRQAMQRVTLRNTGLDALLSKEIICISH